MTVEFFENALNCVKDFITDSVTDHYGRGKVIGIIGGEPQLHPDFKKITQLMASLLPSKRSRGLWTGYEFDKYPLEIVHTYGYINRNPHDRDCFHQPVLVAIHDVIKDEQKMWDLIDRCWLQHQWASAITPKGFFFCEVAAALDTIFQGPGGLPIIPNIWKHNIADFDEQVRMWCPRCGICLPLEGRRDSENKDDISPSNLFELERLGSPRTVKGDYVLFDTSKYVIPESWTPQRYLR